MTRTLTPVLVEFFRAVNGISLEQIRREDGNTRSRPVRHQPQREALMEER